MVAKWLLLQLSNAMGTSLTDSENGIETEGVSTNSLIDQSISP